MSTAQQQNLGPLFNQRENLQDIRVHNLPWRGSSFVEALPLLSHQVFLSKDASQETNDDTLTHELVHAARPSAPFSWPWKRSYEMSPDILRQAQASGKSFHDFDPEQQAEIIRQYHQLQQIHYDPDEPNAKPDLSPYEPFVKQFQQGK